MDTIILKTFADNMLDEFHFKVSCEWLRNYFKSDLVESVDENFLKYGSKESYILGKTDELMENIEDMDEYSINDIYEKASKEKAIISCNEIIIEKEICHNEN
jgi:hypothetical protein